MSKENKKREIQMMIHFEICNYGGINLIRRVVFQFRY